MTSTARTTRAASASAARCRPARRASSSARRLRGLRRLRRESNCLSVQPLLTEFGEKTRIDQTSCNTDYSCLEDCPAFMTVEVDPQAKRAKAALDAAERAEPTWTVPAGTQSVFLTGVGGRGIVTVNQVLATAALRAGPAVELLDQIGLAQKAGPVMGHLRFAADGPLDPSNRVTPGYADAILRLRPADGRRLGQPATAHPRTHARGGLDLGDPHRAGGL